MLLLLTGIFTACENPFEEVKNDLDAIQAMQDVEDKVEKIKKYLNNTIVFDATKVKEYLVDINDNITTILESDAAVSVIRDEYTGDKANFKEEIEAFKISDNYDSLDVESKQIIEDLIDDIGRILNV